MDKQTPASTPRCHTNSSQLGLLGLLPLELRWQIYSNIPLMNYLADKLVYHDGNALQLGILPDDNAHALMNAHPILAEEIYENRRGAGKDLGCSFYASIPQGLPIPWYPTRGLNLQRIQSLDIMVQYFADQYTTPIECVSQLRIIRSNISRLVCLIQEAGLVFAKAYLTVDHEYWDSVEVADFASDTAWLKRHFLLPEDEELEPIMNYILEPLSRLIRLGKRYVEESDRDDGAEYRCLSAIYSLPRIYLDLKVSLRVEKTEEPMVNVDEQTTDEWPTGR